MNGTFAEINASPTTGTVWPEWGHKFFGLAWLGSRLVDFVRMSTDAFSKAARAKSGSRHHAPRIVNASLVTDAAVVVSGRHDID